MLPPGTSQAQSGVAAFPLEPKWRLTLAAGPSAAPAYDQLRAYVPLRNGQLAAVSLSEGTVAWSIDLAATVAPAAGEGLVFVGADGGIEARSAENGNVRWRTLVTGQLTAPLVWDTGWLIAASDRGEILAIRGIDGEVLWRRALDAPVRTAPALAASRIYASLEDGRLAALALDTGEPAWTSRLPEPSNGILPLDDRLFLGSRDNHFYCVDTRNGRIRWRWRTGGDIVGAPVVDRERVYFVSLDNVLRALDRGSGTLRWQRPMPFRPSAGPLRIGEMLVIAGTAAELRAYGTRDGLPAGEFAAASAQGEELQLGAPPHLAGGAAPLLILLTRDGLLQGAAPALASRTP